MTMRNSIEAPYYEIQNNKANDARPVSKHAANFPGMAVVVGVTNQAN